MSIKPEIIMRATIIILLVLVSTTFSQNTYEVTPGVKENKIIIQLNNFSQDNNLSNIEVKLVKGSDNLLFTNSKVLIDNINFEYEKEASFIFDVKFKVTDLKQDTVEFLISDGNKIHLTKQFILVYTLPKEFKLDQNYPNPFNPTTRIRYTIPVSEMNKTLAQNVELKIYDILGNEVSTLVNEKKEPGYYEVEFNASSFASGVYIYHIISGDFVSTKKMLMIK
jgi:hypothetical protein